MPQEESPGRREESGGCQPPRPHLYLDVTDPISFAMNREVVAWEAATGAKVDRLPLALRSANAQLIDATDPMWQKRMGVARGVLPGTAFAVDRTGHPSLLVPDPAKAHELVVFAGREARAADAVRHLSRAFLEEGTDIGRIDVLVAIGEALGFDAIQVKVALDVDAHAEALTEVLALARSEGVESPPSLTWSGRALRGYHDRHKIGKFLDGDPTCTATPVLPSPPA